MSVADEVRRYWDDDSEVYDDVAHHHPTDAAEQAAWAAALSDALPAAPAKVLDCGAGTGFLSLIAARLGHRVTALDLSPGMLGRLKAKADAAGLDIEVVEGPAEEPPPGGFDVVMERHLLWTLPDPAAALSAWRAAAPDGRLVLFEGLWGAGDPMQAFRRRARAALTQLEAWRAAAGGSGHGHGRHEGHHAEYPEHLRRAMPLGGGTTPSAVARLVAESGWPAPQLRRLRDVEWAASLRLPWAERLIGGPPRFSITAGP